MTPHPSVPSFGHEVDMQRFTLRDQPISYQDHGQGPAVVLLHPFPLDADAFVPQLAAFPDHRLLIPDLRGFGGSDAAAEMVTMDDHARDVVALLDALGVERAAIGGVSMGGYVAMALLRVAPERASALLLMDTRSGADSDEARAGRERLAAAVLAEGLDPLVRSLLPRLLSPGSAHLADVEAHIRRTATPEGVAAALRGMAARPDSGADLAAFSGPALVLVGERDEITPLADADRMCAQLRAPTRLVIPDAAHLANIEQPAAVNAAIGSFLRGR